MTPKHMTTSSPTPATDQRQLTDCAIVTRRNKGPIRFSVQWQCTNKFIFRVWLGTYLIGEGHASTPYECETKFQKGQYAAIEQPF